MPRLKDIAIASDVSVRTVSRVLKDSGYVSSETRRKVLQAAEKLGYRANRLARSLRTQQSCEIAIVTWSLDEIHMQKVASMEQALRDREYSLTVLFEHDVTPEKRIELCEELKARQIAGVALLGRRDDAVAWREAFETYRIPELFIDCCDEDIGGIRIDRQQGVYESILYLADSGYQRITYVGRDDPTRLDGYRRACKELQRELRITIVEPRNDPDLKCVRELASNFGELDSRPDAVQMYSDEYAQAFLVGLYQTSLRVPDDIAVVGFGDRDAARLTAPPLTTVAQPNEDVGKVAAELMLQKIHQQKTSAGFSRTLPTRLVVRESA